MREAWAKIKGYDGYEVSSLGRVRSFWNNRYLKETPQKYLKQTIGSHGYPLVNLGRGNMKLVHRLVLESFVGEGEKGFYGCHNNGIKTDNRLSNLRWDSPSGNFSDKDSHGTRWIGGKLKSSKLNPDLAKKIREEYAKGGTSYRKLAEKYGVSDGTIKPLLKGKTWGGSY